MGWCLDGIGKRGAHTIPDKPRPRTTIEGGTDGSQTYTNSYEALRTHALHLANENLRLREDAERYRWLRSQLPSVIDKWSLTRFAAGLQAGDEEIDSARKEGK